MKTLPALAVIAAATAAALGLAGLRGNLFETPDQQGRRLLAAGKAPEAAAVFTDPLWRGVAQMRAGDFKAAAQTFGGLEGALAAYDHGNALVMLGQYDQAVARYDHALALKPGWREAMDNRALAALRAERMKTTGGDESGGQMKADDVVYDKDAKENTTAQPNAAGPAEMSDADIRASWLGRLRPRPADFLRARFAYQLQQQARP